MNYRNITIRHLEFYSDFSYAICIIAIYTKQYIGVS